MEMCPREAIQNNVFGTLNTVKLADEYEVDKSMLSSAKPVLIRNPHDGYKVKTYVDKYVNGSFVKTIRTEETVYKVIYPKYKIGSAEITPAPTATPKVTEPPEDGGEE